MHGQTALKQTFSTNDFDDFATLIKNGNVENVLLDPGPFHATIDVLLTPRLIVSRFTQSRGFFQKGHGSPGYISFLLWKPGHEFKWRNYTLTEGHIAVVWGIEHVALVGNGFEGYPVSINEEYFISECKQRGLKDLLKVFTTESLFTVPKAGLQQVRDEIDAVMAQRAPVQPAAIEKRFMELILTAFSTYDVAPRREYPALDSALETMMNNRDKALPIAAICRENGIAMRTLRHQFQQQFGVSPKAFYKTVRLNALYKALKVRRRDEPIYVVAGRFGFWHMGQLAKDFKALFGVLPGGVVRNR